MREIEKHTKMNSRAGFCWIWLGKWGEKIGNMELWVLGMNANYILVLSWKKIWIELRGREVKIGQLSYDA